MYVNDKRLSANMVFVNTVDSRYLEVEGTL